MAEEKEKQEQVFRIQRVYLKDVSYEAPLTPMVFIDNTGWQPEVSVHINTDKAEFENSIYEVILTLTVTVKSGEDVAYLIEVKQAGLFNIQGFEDGPLNNMLYSFCPNILFPYGREAVASLAMKGGFPQLLLEPVNFDALYAQHLEKAKQNAPAPSTAQ